MNGKPFSAEEDAFILANPSYGGRRLARQFGRPYQSCRDRREKLFNYEPPKLTRDGRIIGEAG